MSNSALVKYIRVSPNRTSPRNHKIDTVTIHCIVGQWTAKQGCDYFATTDRECSANYVVGRDGDIGLSVDEKDRSWCSSNAVNDHRAVTIEVASDTEHPYAVTDKAYAALLDLVTDICRRNGIERLVWSWDRNERVNHLNGCNMTVHRDFDSKSCPGEYLYSRHEAIADEVNRRLDEAAEKESENMTYEKFLEMYKRAREDTDPFYATSEDVPDYWRDEVQGLIEAGAIRGDGVNNVAKRESGLEAIIVAKRYVDNYFGNPE